MGHKSQTSATDRRQESSTNGRRGIVSEERVFLLNDAGHGSSLLEEPSNVQSPKEDAVDDSAGIESPEIVSASF
jgi:hypothetical protein